MSCTDTSSGIPWLIISILAVAIGVTGFMFYSKKGCFAQSVKIENEGGDFENKKSVKQALKKVLAKSSNKEALV